MSILNHPLFKRDDRFEKLPLIRGGITYQEIYPTHLNKPNNIYTTPIIEYYNILDVIKMGHLNNLDDLEIFYLFYKFYSTNNSLHKELEIVDNSFKEFTFKWKGQHSLFYCWSKRYILEKKTYIFK
jgi:hypothetical protein